MTFKIAKTPAKDPLGSFEDIVKISEYPRVFLLELNQKEKILVPRSIKSRILTEWEERNPDKIKEAVQQFSAKHMKHIDGASSFWLIRNLDHVPASTLQPLFKYLTESTFISTAPLFAAIDALLEKSRELGIDPIGTTFGSLDKLALKTVTLFKNPTTPKQNDEIAFSFWLNILSSSDPAQMIQVINTAFSLEQLPEFLQKVRADKNISKNIRDVFFQEMANKHALSFCHLLTRTSEPAKIAAQMQNIFHLLPPPTNINAKTKIQWGGGQKAFENMSVTVDAIENLPWSEEIKSFLKPNLKIFTKFLGEIHGKEVNAMEFYVQKLLLWPFDKIEGSENLKEILEREIQMYVMSVALPPFNKKTIKQLHTALLAFEKTKELHGFLQKDLIKSLPWKTMSAVPPPEKISPSQKRGLEVFSASDEFKSFAKDLPPLMRATQAFVLDCLLGKESSLDPIFPIDTKTSFGPSAKSWCVLLDRQKLKEATSEVYSEKPASQQRKM